MRSGSKCSVIVYDFDDKSKTEVSLPEIGEIQPGINKNYESEKLLFSFSSPLTF